MSNTLRGSMLQTYDVATNDFRYSEGEQVSVVELRSFPNSYAVYHKTGELDWIPKSLVK